MRTTQPTLGSHADEQEFSLEEFTRSHRVRAQPGYGQQPWPWATSQKCLCPPASGRWHVSGVHEEGKMTEPGPCSSEIRLSHQSHWDATCRWSSSHSPAFNCPQRFHGGKKTNSLSSLEAIKLFPSFFQSLKLQSFFYLSGNIALNLLVNE